MMREKMSVRIVVSVCTRQVVDSERERCYKGQGNDWNEGVKVRVTEGTRDVRE